MSTFSMNSFGNGAAVREFVPSSGMGSKPKSNKDLGAIPLERVPSDLSVTTKEWVPPSMQSTPQSSPVLNGGLGPAEYSNKSGWNQGNGYDEAGDMGEIEDDLSLNWADSLTTLPAPPRRTLQTIGIPDPIRQHFQSLDHASLRQMEPNDERYKDMPNRFHSAFALDDVYAQSQRGTGGSYGYPSAVYKAIDRTDSQMYALRRVDNARITPQTAAIAKAVMSKWGEVRHPSVCTLYNISIERGGIFFLHGFHPAAQTLRQRFIDQRGALLAESLLWRLLVQLAAGVHALHMRGVPLRNISVSHVLLTSGTVARFSGVGIVDVLESESRKTLADLLQEDMVKLGYLVLSLATRTLCNAKNAEQAMQLLQRNYSPDLRQVVLAMFQANTSIANLNQLLAPRLLDELDQSAAAADALHSHLRGEYENGRMLRLMLKLNMVTERPEFAHSPQWSETGDRYVLKLFRDYVFHQNSQDGLPVLDAGHIVSALNKLDCGDPEKILLCSRDNKDILVVSFADVRRCLEAAVHDLTEMSAQGRHQHSQQQQQQQMQMQQQQMQMQHQHQQMQSPRGQFVPHGRGGR